MPEEEENDQVHTVRPSESGAHRVREEGAGGPGRRQARDLGLLIHTRERGVEVEARRVDALLVRLDDVAKDIARLEAQIGEARRQRDAAAQQPSGEPPVPTTTP